MNWQSLLQEISAGDTRSLARAISLVENEATGYGDLLMQLPPDARSSIIGITGPPGAGKSTVTDGLIELLAAEGKKVAVVCVDPSSPFNQGALLGDRIRMNSWYNHPLVYIRSLATRGSLGGLHPKIVEITDLMKAAGFDYIIVETVGVGQSEIEVAGLADCTVVVLVPEAGDEIQTMKAGLMEIAGIFAVNKSDRPGADLFVKNLRAMLAPDFHHQKATPEIVKTIAISREGIGRLREAIAKCLETAGHADRRSWLLAEKAYYLIRRHRMENVSKNQLAEKISLLLQQRQFNLYRLVEEFI